MKLSVSKIAISVAALMVSILAATLISQNAARIGAEPLLIRALLLNAAVLAALIAVYPFYPVFAARPGAYGLVVCLPALAPSFIYYLFLLPAQAGMGISAEQTSSQLITDRSSNGIIEVGFSYPIYTPAITVRNNGLYTKQVNVFLRMIDGNNEASLFRGVRKIIPGTSLSVESTVRGMLSENAEYTFNPLELPPLSTVSGQVVFIISNLEDGSTFTEALGRANQVTFELRNPETGELILEFPLDRI